MNEQQKIPNSPPCPQCFTAVSPPTKAWHAGWAGAQVIGNNLIDQLRQRLGEAEASGHPHAEQAQAGGVPVMVRAWLSDCAEELERLHYHALRDHRAQHQATEWVATVTAELATLRQRLTEIEIECREAWKQAAYWRPRAEQAEAKLALAEQDARRYRVVRNNALWAKSHSGFVLWSILLQMEKPIDAASLTPDSEAQWLDAAIDAAIASQGDP